MTNKYFMPEQWAEKAANKTLTARDFFMRALHKALDSKAENKAEVFRGLLLKYFTPITNANKLANGRTPWQTIEHIAAWTSYNRIMSRFRIMSQTLSPEEKALISELFPNNGWGPEAQLRDPTYVYFFTRQDISYEQQLVQTAHAASVVAQDFEFDARHQHFIIFGLPNEDALEAKRTALIHAGVHTVAFFEPDMGNTLTSFATAPIRGSYARRKGWFAKDSLLCLPVKQLADAE